ncbi:MAG: hypothetical protein AB7R69_01125 [Candidatus Babeliales bacterium]
MEIETQKGSCHTHDHEQASVLSELICHLPYAIFSVAFGLIILSFLAFGGMADGSKAHAKGLHMLFHSFHFLHIIFATTGCLVTFSRFSSNIVKGLVVSLFTALFFCTLSDVVLPYLTGTMFGVHMHFHICLWSELHNIVPFLSIGLLNGFILSRHTTVNRAAYSVASHFGHILTSSLASLFYLVSEGFAQWNVYMGMVFVLLIIAVVVPCTFADVIVPVLFAQMGNKNEKHQASKH